MREDWVEIKLRDLVKNPQKDIVDGPFGSNLKAGEYVDNGIPVFKIQNIKANTFLDKNIKYVTEKKAKTLDRHSFKAGDLIITKLGDPLGLCCEVPNKYPYGIIVADLLRFRPFEKIVNKKFLRYCINSNFIQTQLRVITKGTTRPRVNLSIVRDLKFYLAPLPEQRAIVAKIEQLFSELDNSIANLQAAKDQLDIYRQAVLKKAFEGALTKEYRQNHRLNGLGDDTDLKSENGENRKISEINQSVAIRDSDKREVNVNGIEAKIPINWLFTNIGEYAKLQGGFAFKSKEYTKKGISLVKIGNVHYQNVDWSNITYIDSMRYKEFEEYSLNENDVLIAMTRPVIKSLNTVKTVVVKKNDLPALLNQRVGRFKIVNDLDKDYLKYFIFTDFFKKRIIKESSSTQQPNISSKKIENFDFVLPPTKNEQTQIVQQIEIRLSVCDNVQNSIDEGLQKAEALRQSILKKAFAGELLSEAELAACRNEADYEPAEKLVEKVRAELA